ncbi:cobalamin biosynthesis protein CobG [Yimella sp. RIT 621]|nr:cobalamin biosynthesis protein CobG [Yimella sp. RIT 621]
MLHGVTVPSDRSGADRCPGLLRPHLADDGALVRLRLPGGRLKTATLHRLGDISIQHGAPFVQLTSRGNLQLRSLPNPLTPQLISQIEATGLLPSASHERVRNIIADPFDETLPPLVAALDAALIAGQLLAGLSGRWLFAVAGREGQVLGEPYDVAFQRLSETSGRLLVGGMGVDCAPEDAVAAMLDRARCFLRVRDDESHWNVRDLPPESPVFAGLAPVDVDAAPPPAPGRHTPDDANQHAVVLGVPLGMLTIEQIELLRRVAEEIVVTPWRSIVVRTDAVDIGLDVFEAGGFAVAALSPWATLSACVGAPWCRRTDTPTVELTTAAAASLPIDSPRTHVVGCERACGRPAGEHRLVIAPRTVQEILP